MTYVSAALYAAKEVDNLRKQIEALKAENAQLRKIINSLAPENSKLREALEKIAEIYVDPHMAREVARATLQKEETK